MIQSMLVDTPGHCLTIGIWIKATFSLSKNTNLVEDQQCINKQGELYRLMRAFSLFCPDINLSNLSLKMGSEIVHRVWIIWPWLRLKKKLVRQLFCYRLCCKCIWILLYLRTTLVCQWLAIGWWLSLGTPLSFTNKTDRHDPTKTLLKMALSNQKKSKNRTTLCVLLEQQFHLVINRFSNYFIDSDKHQKVHCFIYSICGISRIILDYPSVAIIPPPEEEVPFPFSQYP